LLPEQLNDIFALKQNTPFFGVSRKLTLFVIMYIVLAVPLQTAGQLAGFVGELPGEVDPIPA